MDRSLIAGNASPPFADLVTDAVRYWEPRRLVYNAVLAAVVIAHFFACWPTSWVLVSVDLVLQLFMLAVFANALYCLAYVADVVVQLSTARNARWRVRLVVFLTGTALAATITRFVSMALFVHEVRRG